MLNGPSVKISSFATAEVIAGFFHMSSFPLQVDISLLVMFVKIISTAHLSLEVKCKMLFRRAEVRTVKGLRTGITAFFHAPRHHRIMWGKILVYVSISYTFTV